MESTVYRRGSDGKVIGTPEVKSVTETPIEPIFTVTTYRAGEIGQTKAQPKVVVEKPQPVIPTPPAIVQPTPPAPVVKAQVPAVTQTPDAKPKSALPKAPIFTLPKFAMPKISLSVGLHT